MLNVRNLDDQTYTQIVENAEGRLPWICPRWTNHNASDPGITILELMAWYKELQQYHMNRLTDDLRLKLLKLAGISPVHASPAVCGLFLGRERKARPPLERLYTAESIPFELAEPLPEERPAIERVAISAPGRHTDVTTIFRDNRVTFAPFMSETGRSSLRVGFSSLPKDTLSLWFQVAKPAGSVRNPFARDSADPRSIRWTCEGAAGTELVRDDTHALSVSGRVSLRWSGTWPTGAMGLHWLVLELIEPGCEEEVRIEGISENMYMAVQRETWAGTHGFTVDAAAGTEIEINDALGRDGIPVVFLRVGGRWTETEDWVPTRREDGTTIKLDTSRADTDGGENLMVVCLDAERAPEMLFDAKGLPGETFYLRLEGRTALTEHFSLLCETLMEDGTVSPTLWRCVDDLYDKGPRDRVFTYDADRETVTFGDGEHGALLVGGHGAVLAAELTVTRCAGGCIPADAGLWFNGDSEPVAHTDAFGGTARESASEAQARLLRELSVTRKCVSAQDYERIARLTPGLRVGKVKAIPGFDPEDPTGVSRFPVVTVVTAPAGDGEKPMPDRRFLASIKRELDSVRPIGVKVCVTPPEYIDIDVSVSVRGGDSGTDAYLRERIEEYLAGDRVGVGGTVAAGDIAAAAQAAPGVLQVISVRVTTPDAGCRQTSEGDVGLPRRGIPCLRALRLTRQSAQAQRL